MTIHTPLITPTAAAAHNRRRAFRAKIAHHHAALITKTQPALVHPIIPEPLSAAIPTDTLPTVPPCAPSPHSLSRTILNIQKLCAAHYNITVHDLLSPYRDLRFTHPRHVAVYLCRTLTRSSLPVIGKRFGDRDHATILHAYRKIRDLIQRDPELADEIASLLDHFTDIEQDQQTTSQPTDIPHALTIEP